MLKLFKPSVILEDLGPLLQYLPVTLGIALVSIFFAFLLGFFVAMIKINKVPVLSKIAAFYVSFTRGTADSGTVVSVLLRNPDFAQYLNYYFGMNLNINSVPNVVFVLVAFALNEGAYASGKYPCSHSLC